MQQNILDVWPDADIRVYAVYFEMVAGDEGARTQTRPGEELHDPRVRFFWDDGRVLGRWYDENVTKLGRRTGDEDRIEWDCYIIYGPEAEWGERSNHHSWGRPLNQERERLRNALASMLE